VKNYDSKLTAWGARILEDGAVRFRLWAPACSGIELMIEGEALPRPLKANAGGWHDLTTRDVGAGCRYRYRLPNGLSVPDPASCFQPEDVAGPSEVIDHRAYQWQNESWLGRPWHTAVIYELHVGAFTRKGTFDAVAERLSHLVKLGVTAIQLMPIGDFPGRFNWGYDGVLPYAPDSSYGRPENLKALIDAAHSQGLMVFLDVVYNHFGPEGNYLSQYAPPFFTDRHHTPWGSAINFDGAESEPVRRFVVENALYWLEEFRFDGLRLDAVHHLIDESRTHILEELATAVRHRYPGRHIHLILENEENEASRLIRDDRGRPLQYTAQWNDDAHHVLHTAISGEAHGYYAEYRGDDEKLTRALGEGFAFQGQVMEFRGRPRGQPSADLPPEAFIAFLQNHDQIGNRAFGERFGAFATPEAARAASAVYLLLPQIPMIFMGEELNAPQPFLFFCDFTGDLAAAIREGRRKEFESFPAFREEHPELRIPDPDDVETFNSTKLDMTHAQSSDSEAWEDRYRRLLMVRQREISPRIPFIIRGADRSESLGPSAVRVTWKVSPSENLVLTANLSETGIPDVKAAPGRIIWDENVDSNDGSLPPWSVRWVLM
jgi:malto-oligosyltrehalose trehalohydrolase